MTTQKLPGPQQANQAVRPGSRWAICVGMSESGCSNVQNVHFSIYSPFALSWHSSTYSWNGILGIFHLCVTGCDSDVLPRQHCVRIRRSCAASLTLCYNMSVITCSDVVTKFDKQTACWNPAKNKMFRKGKQLQSQTKEVITSCTTSSKIIWRRQEFLLIF